MERTVCLVTGAEDLIGISTIIKNPLSFSKIIECTLRGQIYRYELISLWISF
jgi:hypothetical protein